jgi:hypothetical protein
MVFESLVVDPDIKVLIQALVTNQIAAEQSTDLMSGKGNGLIVLLHGYVSHKNKCLDILLRTSKWPWYRQDAHC